MNKWSHRLITTIEIREGTIRKEEATTSEEEDSQEAAEEEAMALTGIIKRALMMKEHAMWPMTHQILRKYLSPKTQESKSNPMALEWARITTAQAKGGEKTGHRRTEGTIRGATECKATTKEGTMKREREESQIPEGKRLLMGKDKAETGEDFQGTATTTDTLKGEEIHTPIMSTKVETRITKKTIVEGETETRISKKRKSKEEIRSSLGE